MQFLITITIITITMKEDILKIQMVKRPRTHSNHGCGMAVGDAVRSKGALMGFQIKAEDGTPEAQHIGFNILVEKLWSQELLEHLLAQSWNPFSFSLSFFFLLVEVMQNICIKILDFLNLILSEVYYWILYNCDMVGCVFLPLLITFCLWCV